MRERRFILTSSKFKGSVLFKYGLNGFLIAFKIDALLSDEQHRWLLKQVPLHMNSIGNFSKLSDSLKVEEVPVDLSFQNFWKTYGNYAGKKKKCEQLWEALNTTERSKCLNYLPIYKTQKSKDGTALAYPETYVNNRVWDN